MTHGERWTAGAAGNVRAVSIRSQARAHSFHRASTQASASDLQQQRVHLACSTCSAELMRWVDSCRICGTAPIKAFTGISCSLRAHGRSRLRTRHPACSSTHRETCQQTTHSDWCCELLPWKRADFCCAPRVCRWVVGGGHLWFAAAGALSVFIDGGLLFGGDSVADKRTGIGAYLAADNTLFLSGGQSQVDGSYLADVWQAALQSQTSVVWQRLTPPAGGGFSPCTLPIMMQDSAKNLYHFCSQVAPAVVSDVLWVSAASNPSPLGSSWVRVDGTNCASTWPFLPSPALFAGVFDVASNHLILLGGEQEGNPTQNAATAIVQLLASEATDTENQKDGLQKWTTCAAPVSSSSGGETPSSSGSAVWSSSGSDVLSSSAAEVSSSAASPVSSSADALSSSGSDDVSSSSSSASPGPVPPLPVSSSAAPSPPMSSSSTGGSAPSSGDDGSSSGLSSGAKAAIIVVVLLLAGGALAAYVWRVPLMIRWRNLLASCSGAGNSSYASMREPRRRDPHSEFTSYQTW